MTAQAGDVTSPQTAESQLCPHTHTTCARSKATTSVSLVNPSGVANSCGSKGYMRLRYVGLWACYSFYWACRQPQW